MTRYVVEFHLFQVTKKIFGEFAFQNKKASSRIEYYYVCSKNINIILFI